MRVNLDPLQTYLQAADENNAHHLSDPPELMPLIEQLDSIFRDEIFFGEFEIDATAALLSMNAYMLLLASIRQALSGHLAAVFPIARSALESSCYGYLIAHQPSLGDTWLNRHDSEQHYKQSKKKFNPAVSSVSKALKSDFPSMAEYVQAQYDAVIDYGAHPNPKSIVDRLEDKGAVDSESHHFELCGLYGKNSWEVNYGLLVAAEVGQAVAFVIASSMHDHPTLSAPSSVFNDYTDYKIKTVDKLNRAPVSYTEAMYTKYKPA